MTTREAAYSSVEQVVKKFKGLSAPERRSLNEMATRLGYILPLFSALGWNTSDTTEVSPEEKVSRGWVDFAFHISGVPRFFLETKRIAEDLGDLRWFRQAVDYAWTKSVTWALLSDFEGLKVYNAEWKVDDPAQARFIEFSVDTYLTDFERLWWLSRPEMAAGTLDREAEKVGKKARKEPVSQSLFDDLKEWRGRLFKTLLAYNPMWSPAQIDRAVLWILNRLIFVRTAEDRRVEPPRLLPLLRQIEEQRRWADLPAELAKLFREFDSTYNSELFAVHYSEKLDSEHEPFQSLIKGLHEKRFVRYNFNAIDADVLGTVYEQYLGHVIADPEAAEAVEKRRKRKSQGIYYTPTFVVKYIVQQTLGRHLEEHGFQPHRPVRVLDMACGSGSFLIEAFDVLDRYLARQRGHAHGESEDVRDYARRMEVLTQCIYGVDKDEQAVAVARLNLLLKALHTRDKLPMLNNIRAGDSLISGTPDDLQGAFGKQWKEKRPFNWEEEWPEAMAEGGFDVIVGNPPYVRPHNLPAELKSYLWKYYPTFVGKSDLYCCFMQRAIDLAKPGGLVSFVVSDGWLRLDSFQAIRKHILAKCRVTELTNLPEKVFEDATVKVGVFVFQKEETSASRSRQPIAIRQLTANTSTPTDIGKIKQAVFEKTHRNVFDLSLTPGSQSLKARMEEGNPSIADLLDIQFGLKTGDDSKFIHQSAKTKQHKPLLRGENVHRYRSEFAGEFVWYVPRKMREHRATARPGDEQRFAQPKILVRDTGAHFECTLDLEHYYVKDVLILTRKPETPYSLHYVVGLLNSRATRYYYETTFPTLHVQKSELAVVPIRGININTPKGKRQHDKVVALVTEMLQLQKEHTEAERNKEDRRHALKRRIEQVDAEIDRIVYDLYGLSDDEIRLVEEATRQ